MGKKFHEELLHWIWSNRQLTSPLKTTVGKAVIIHQTGQVNPSDGPDFINAKITIENLTWHGHVEIHWKAEDWFRHGHDKDLNYKNVVLHVVYEKTGEVQQKPDIPTLCIKSFLDKPLASFCKGAQSETRLHCAKSLATISPAALEAQIAKSHKQYFEQKIDNLLRFYDTEVIPSRAWQTMTIIALFDGLGILHNREPMRKLGRILLHEYAKCSSLLELKRLARRQAFNSKTYNWKRKGSRPANRPEPRIAQACDLFWHIIQTPVKHWFDTSVSQSFEECIESVSSKPRLGKKRSGVLYGTVWLPTMYLLGDLFGSAKISSAARKAWMQHRTSLPASVRRPFREAGIPEFIYRKKLGTVHQLRSYCEARQCHKCEVFKSAICT